MPPDRSAQRRRISPRPLVVGRHSRRLDAEGLLPALSMMYWQPTTTSSFHHDECGSPSKLLGCDFLATSTTGRGGGPKSQRRDHGAAPSPVARLPGGANWLGVGEGDGHG